MTLSHCQNIWWYLSLSNLHVFFFLGRNCMLMLVLRLTILSFRWDAIIYFTRFAIWGGPRVGIIDSQGKVAYILLPVSSVTQWFVVPLSCTLLHDWLMEGESELQRVRWTSIYYYCKRSRIMHVTYQNRWFCLIEPTRYGWVSWVRSQTRPDVTQMDWVVVQTQ